jgi:hypothetical protein
MKPKKVDFLFINCQPKFDLSHTSDIVRRVNVKCVWQQPGQRDHYRYSAGSVDFFIRFLCAADLNASKIVAKWSKKLHQSVREQYLLIDIKQIKIADAEKFP